jgi:hypothetical protein
VKETRKDIQRLRDEVTYAFDVPMSDTEMDGETSTGCSDEDVGSTTQPLHVIPVTDQFY